MSKYKKPLRSYLIYVIFFIIILIMVETFAPDQEISPYIIGTGFTEKFLLFVGFWTIGAIIGALVFGYILGPFFLFMHKVTIGRKMKYGIQDNLESENPKFVSKAIFPALMGLNFALIFALNPDIANLVVDASVLERTSGAGASFLSILAFLVILSLTVGIGMALFSPIWFLLDAGIVYTNQEKVREKTQEVPIIARSVGGWYQYLLKGYAGIAVIFGYYQLVSSFLAGIVGSTDSPMGLAVLVNVMILLPIVYLIALASIPGMVILDKTKTHRVNYMRKWAAKFGITEKVQISFEKINP